MRKIKLHIELEYDDDIMHGTDKDELIWFMDDVLDEAYGTLHLRSDLIGDDVGSVKVIGNA